MQHLRQQVDRIDLKMLRLLQQRTKLSGQIGKMKRRHGAVIYVPDRERELVARLTRLSRGQLPPRLIAALFREIMSGSRAAQGQAPIGLLKASASVVMPAGHLIFGACGQFSPGKTWPELAKGLVSGNLSLTLLTGTDLLHALHLKRWRSEFSTRFTVVGDFAPIRDGKIPLAEKIFIVTPREETPSRQATRMLILIECKSTLNAIKSLQRDMADLSLHTEPLNRRGSTVTLALLALTKPSNGTLAIKRLLAAAKLTRVPLSILGTYPGTEDYGG